MAVQDEIPKSRITLTYETEVNGEPEDVNLPLRLLVAGDFSLGSSKDRKEDLENRDVRNVEGSLDAVMENMGMKLDFLVENKVDPDKSEEMEVSLPISSMKSFSPDEVAKNVPKLRGLLLLKKLLLEAQANLNNRKELRNLLNNLYSNPDAFNKLLEQLKDFEGLRLPSKEDKSE